MATIKNPTTIVSVKGGSTDVLNGVIKQYKASTSTIDANTFVEFVAGALDTSGVSATSAQLLTNNSYISKTTDYDAIKLSEDRVFVVFPNNSGGYAYGAVCTVSGDTITVGTPKSLFGNSGGNNNYSYMNLALLEDGKVFITHRGSNSYLYGAVCTVSGDTITVGTDTALVSASGSSEAASVAVLSATSVFVSHRGGTSSAPTLSAVVCTISGTTITPGTDTTLVAGEAYTYPYDQSHAITLSSSKVVVTHNYGEETSSSTNALKAVVCTISGTTITPGTDTTINTTNKAPLGSQAVGISPDKILVTYCYGWNLSGTGRTLSAFFCNISGTSITVAGDTRISTDSQSCQCSLELLSSNTFLVTYLDSSAKVTKAVVCTFSGNTITVGTKSTILNYYVSGGTLVSLAANKILYLPLTAHSAFDSLRYKLTGIVMPGVSAIKPSETKIDGLSETQCTPTVAGDVWVLA